MKKNLIIFMALLAASTINAEPELVPVRPVPTIPNNGDDPRSPILILCEDRDGDGLFYWGIGPKPSYSPAWAPDDADGDDSNPSLGRMDEFGFCEDIGSSHPVYEYIENDSTLTSGHQRTAHLGILRGVTVTFQSQQTFVSDSKLLLDNGATLILDGTCLDGSCLQPYVGSTIILNNGASISMPFEAPIGVELIINNGSVE